MANENRSNNSAFSQEPDRRIARVALYARVGTLNNRSRELSTPSGRLMFQIIGAMAEFERALIQEKLRLLTHSMNAYHGAVVGGGCRVAILRAFRDR
jgi:resolvase-like protein